MKIWGSLKVVVIGDDFAVSSSALFSQNKLPSVPDLCYWVSLLSIQTGANFLTYASIGNKTSQMVSSFRSQVTNNNPTHCIIFAGYSDVKAGVPFDTTIANIRTLIDLCRNAGITPIVILPPPCFPLDTDKEAILYTIRESVVEYCIELGDVRHINLYGEPFLQGGKQCPDYYLADLTYCSQLGHMTIAQQILGEGNDPGDLGVITKYTPIGICVNESTGIWTWINKNGFDIFPDTPNPIPEEIPIQDTSSKVVGICVNESTGTWTWVDGGGGDIFPSQPNPTPEPVYIIDMTPRVYQIEHTYEYKKKYLGGLFHKHKTKTITCYYEAPKGLYEMGKVKVLFTCNDDISPMAIRYWEETLGMKVIIYHCTHD